MTRIDQRFQQLSRDGRKGLVPFFTCGDPSFEACVPVMHALVAGGADVLEVGVPFSDPQADGPVIQRSSERALARRVGLRSVLEACRRFRDDDQTTPVVLMGYLNPIEIYGAARFAVDAAAAGVDAVLVVDCPPEEAAELRATLDQAALQLILLASPTTTDQRLDLLCEQAAGYIYYVAFAGVTGAGILDAGAVQDRLATLRARTGKPLAVGFGVKDAASAVAVARGADAVVIGSALVERLSEATDVEAAAATACDFLSPIRAALDGVNG